MSEVGLVRFARVALGVGEAVLPYYRSKFSKRTFTQPQLLAILCPMRYEGWTLHKAEVRSAEHGVSCQMLWACASRPSTPRSTVSCGVLRSKPCWPP
jgi:hypothetical protein